MNKETPEQEAERLYPLPSGAAGLESDYTLSDVRVMQQQAHITAARMYMGEAERLRKETATWKELAHKYVDRIKELEQAVELYRKGISNYDL